MRFLRVMMFSFIDKPSCFDEFEDKPALWISYNLAPVYYQLTQRGDAIEIHIGAQGRKGKQHLRKASEAAKLWIKETFPWCKCVLVITKLKSIDNLCKKINLCFLRKAEFEKGLMNIWVWRYE